MCVPAWPQLLIVIVSFDLLNLRDRSIQNCVGEGDLKVGCHGPRVQRVIDFQAQKSMPPDDYVLTEHAL